MEIVQNINKWSTQIKAQSSIQVIIQILKFNHADLQ